MTLSRLLAIMEKRSFLDGGPLVTQCHLREKRKSGASESPDVGIGRGRCAGRGTVLPFESNSRLARIVIRSTNEAVTYYIFYKSSNVRENGVYQRQLDERSRMYFDTTLRDGLAVSRWLRG